MKIIRWIIFFAFLLQILTGPLAQAQSWQQPKPLTHHLQQTVQQMLRSQPKILQAQIIPVNSGQDLLPLWPQSFRAGNRYKFAVIIETLSISLLSLIIVFCLPMITDLHEVLVPVLLSIVPIIFTTLHVKNGVSKKDLFKTFVLGTLTSFTWLAPYGIVVIWGYSFLLILVLLKIAKDRTIRKKFFICIAMYILTLPFIAMMFSFPEHKLIFQICIIVP